MSRAKESAIVHVVADDIGQAVEDLSWDWGRERRQHWAIDTGTPDERPGRHPLEVEADKRVPGKLRAVLGRARLKAERAAVAAAAEAPDADTRKNIITLDRQIQLLDQRLKLWNDPFAGRPSIAPVETPVPERGMGPPI